MVLEEHRKWDWGAVEGERRNVAGSVGGMRVAWRFWGGKNRKKITSLSHPEGCWWLESLEKTGA